MPPLSEKDSNALASRKALGKRKRVEIDLTGDSDAPAAAAAAAAAKKPHTQARSQDSRSTPSLSTAPPSSYHSRYEGLYAPPASIRGGPTPSYASGTQQHSQTERHDWLADEADVNEIVGSSQDDAEGSEQLELYGDLSTKVVGVRYYRGFANSGEHILMRREPGNPYDSNAIRIDNVAGTQIGHIPRGVAEKLARYMDDRSLRIEGQLAGEIGSFDCPLTVHMFGPPASSDQGRQLQTRMAADRLPTKALQQAERAAKQREKERQQAEKKRLVEARRAAADKGARVPPAGPLGYASQNVSSGSSNPSDISDILESSERIDPRAIARAGDQLGLSEDALKQMPMAAKPKSIKTEMLPYQLQALHWMLNAESPKLPTRDSQQPVQLWNLSGNGRYTNIATMFSTQHPQLASGGILADDMGLGKTLEMISLIAADAEEYGRGPTLVVAPLSVMSNWTHQAMLHVKQENKLEVYTYHAAGRIKMRPEEFAKYDIVVTTYGTLASDYMPSSGKGPKKPDRELRSHGLYSVDWRRIVLDEGHTIRNPQTKGTAAAMSLTARSKWVLTGTPIVNSLRDLYSLLRFVGITGGLEQWDIYNSVLVRPLKRESGTATLLLKAIMRAFTLRRTKDLVDLRLPPLEEYVHKIDFSPKEQERYDALAAEAKGVLKKFEIKRETGGHGSNEAYNHLLEILLRMRQCCNHWQLCGERVTKLLAVLESSKTVELTPENKKALQDILQVQIDCSEDCAICLETLHQPVITTCGHAFGRDCIQKVIQGQHKCPMCRAELKDETILVEPADEYGEGSVVDEIDLKQSSSKLDALVKILDANQASGNKTIVFSQWTGFLNIVEGRLNGEGYKCCRIDGTMPVEKRNDALQSLEKDDSTTVMLASLGACAVGLNLTAANNVILCDTWWAPAIEDQAVDRIHRLGQKKATKVFRLVMDNTIEETTLSIQQDKRKLMMLAFSEKHNKRANARTTGRLADIQRLLA